MFQAGWAKLTSGWLDPTTHSTYGHLAYNYFATGRHTWAAGNTLQIAPGWFLEAADWSAVVLEVGFGLALFHRETMHFFLAFACLFHVGVWILFDIAFPTNVVVYAAFLPYGNWIHYLVSKIPPELSRGSILDARPFTPSWRHSQPPPWRLH